MNINTKPVKLSAFASVYGDEVRAVESIENFDELCQKEGLVLGMKVMGSESFTQITRPIEECVRECITKTIKKSGLSPESIDNIILTTTDRNLPHLDSDFIKEVLGPLGLVNSVPTFLSMQQCVSSVSAIDYGTKLLQYPKNKNVIVVSFDMVEVERDRIRSFALFGDAVTSCLINRESEGLSFLSYDISIDFDGVKGTDTFESRKKIFSETSQNLFDEESDNISDITACFSTNLYLPIAQFNTSVSGLNGKQLYIKTLKGYGHCGNCDWMMNLEHYEKNVGFKSGEKFMVQSFAPGFFAACLLEF